MFAILGNGDFQPSSLWRFNLKTDKWSEIPTTGFPIGKYRHILHDPSTHRIITYWDGRGQVYSVPESGGTWQSVGSTSNSDNWYGAAPFMNPQTNQLTVFGGYGFFTWKNSLVGFDKTTASWVDQPQSGTRPEPRFAMTAAVDEEGKAFFINSGQGSASGNQFDGARVFNDLWKFDLRTNTWTTIIADDGAANPTIGAGMDLVRPKNSIYRFGGSHGAGDPNYISVVEVVNLGAPVPAWATVSTTGNGPSPRNSMGVYYDAPRKRLIVVGGYQLDGAVKLDVYGLALP